MPSFVKYVKEYMTLKTMKKNLVVKPKKGTENPISPLTA